MTLPARRPASDQAPKLLISCEHGGNEVPAELQTFFATAEARRHLHSHRGYDPGSLSAATSIAASCGAAIQTSVVSRLVVDLNRSLHSDQLLSKFVVPASEAIKTAILQTYYDPYWERVTEFIKQAILAGQAVLHLSIHTFTPRFRGTERKFDIGVLFDPARRREAAVSQRLLQEFSLRGFQAFPNRPYLGTDDGLTTSLRTQFTDPEYAGIEIEINNRVARWSEKSIAACHAKLASAIKAAIA